MANTTNKGVGASQLPYEYKSEYLKNYRAKQAGQNVAPSNSGYEYKSSYLQQYRERQKQQAAEQAQIEQQMAMEAETPRKATLRDLTLGSIGRGYAASRYGDKQYDAIMTDNARKDAKAAEAKAKLEQDKFNFEAQSGVGKAISGAGELIGQQIYNARKSLPYIGANVAGAAAVGAAIPLPEEVVTVPAAVARGFTQGSAVTGFQVSAANAYDEMIEAGISEDTAKKVANVIGLGMGALEGVQADELLKSAKILNSVKGEASQKAASNILKVLGKLGKSTALETGEEVAQETVSMIGQDYARKLEGIENFGEEEYKRRLGETAVQSALSFGLLGGAGAVGGAVLNRNNIKAQPNEAKSANDDAKNTPKRANNIDTLDNNASRASSEGMKVKVEENASLTAENGTKNSDLKGYSEKNEELTQKTALKPENEVLSADFENETAKKGVYKTENGVLSADNNVTDTNVGNIQAENDTEKAVASRMTNDTAQAETQGNTAIPLTMERYGEEGKKVFANVQNDAVKSAEFDKYYQAGQIGSARPNLNGALNKTEATAAYMAGVMDGRTNQTNYAKRQYVTNENAGLDLESAKNISGGDRIVLNTLGKAFGKRVVIAPTLTDASGNALNAKIDNAKGIIYIAENAHNNAVDGKRVAMSHELVHDMRIAAPEEFKTLARLVVEFKQKSNNYDAELAKTAELYGLNEGQLDYYDTLEEMVADFIADKAGAERLVQMVSNDKTLAQKVAEAIRNLINKVSKLALDKNTRALVNEWEDLLKQLETTVKATEQKVKETKYPADAKIGDDSFVVSEVRESKKSAKYDIEQDIMRQDLVKYGVFTEAESYQFVNNLSDLIDNVITPNASILDMNEEFGMDDRKNISYKPNSDSLYKVSLDFSTLCKKRLMSQYVTEQLQLRLGRAITNKEQLAIRDRLLELKKENDSIEVACALCYVEAARLKSPVQINRFLKDRTGYMTKYFAKANKEFDAKVKQLQIDMKVERGYEADATISKLPQKDKNAINDATRKMRMGYKPSAEEMAVIEIANSLDDRAFLTLGNLEKLAEEQPDIYKAFAGHVASSTRSKELQGNTAYYYGDSRREGVSDALIALMNAENGLRHQSWSDFQSIHLLDTIVAIAELSTRKAKMQAYTKVPNFVKLVGRTGMMINLSLIPDGRTGFINGKLAFSNIEGMDFETAKKLRDTYANTTGTIAIGINDQQIKALLASGEIDYVIPYHASGLNKELRRIVKLESWDDYQNKQSEKKIEGYANLANNPDWHKKPDFSEWFKADEVDISKDGVTIMREAAERYKQLCLERGLKPKFDDFKNEPNYWKLLIDRKMVDHKTGKIIIQEQVRPIFDFDVITEMLNEEVQSYDADLNERLMDTLVGFYGDGGKNSEISQRIKQLDKEGKARETAKKKGVYEAYEQFPMIDVAVAGDERYSKKVDKNSDEDYNGIKGGAKDDRIRNLNRRTDSGIYEEISKAGRSGYNFGGKDLLQKKNRLGQNAGRTFKSIVGTPTTIKGTGFTYDKVDVADYGSIPRLIVEELKKFGFIGEVFVGEIFYKGNPIEVYDGDCAAVGLKQIFVGCYALDDPKGVAAHEAIHNHILLNNPQAIAYHNAITDNVDENTKEAVLFKTMLTSNGYDADIDFIDELEANFGEWLYTTKYGNTNTSNIKLITKYKNMFKDFDAVSKAYDNYIDAVIGIDNVNPKDASQTLAESLLGKINNVTNNTRSSKMSEPIIPDGYKERGFNESVRTKTDYEDIIQQEFIDNPEIYKQLANKVTKEKAKAIMDKGLAFAETEFPKLLERMDATAIALGDMMAREYSNMGEHDKAVSVIRDMARQLTKAGQFSQAAVIALTKSNPMTALAYAKRDIDKLNADGHKQFGKKWKDFELTADEEAMFENIRQGDAEGIKKAYEVINKRIEKEYPTTIWQKFVEASRISMLLNPRTNIKNIVSNFLLWPVTRGSGMVSAGMQKAYQHFNKNYKATQSAMPVKKDVRALAEGVWEDIKDTLETTNKYNEGIKANKRDVVVFKEGIGTRVMENIAPGTLHKLNQLMNTDDAGLMETLRRATYYFLELGDNAFVKKNFISRLGSYLQANNITDLKQLSEEDLQGAIAVAYKEALRATFKDDTAFSNLLARIKHTGDPYLDAMMEMIMPFTKTPANIAMRGIDYSPIGFINTLNKYKKNGDLDELFDELGKNSLGTALIAFGMWLFGKGFVTGGEPENEKEAAFLKQQGWQAYAVKTPNGYVTYDWAQPAAIPIIMGVTIAESLEEGRLGVVDAVKNAGVASFNQWIELSPLQSLQEVMGGYDSVGENLLNTAIEMPQRLIPSALGATARTADTTQRVTYSKGNVAQTQKDLAKSKVPGLSQTLPAAYDTWGQVKKRDNSTFGAAFSQYINPSSYKRSTATEVDAEIERLYKEVGDSAVYPRKASYSIEKGGKTYTLSNAEYSEYQRIMGELSYDGVKALMAKPAYSSLTDIEKAEIIKDIYDNAFEKAKFTIMEGQGYEKTSEDIRTAKETKIKQVYMEATPENTAEYYIAYYILNNAESDKASNGKTIAGSKKKNGINRLVELGFTRSQAKRMYEAMH